MDIIVAPIPKANIVSIFLIKFFFSRLKPAANMIGGRINKKKLPESNFKSKLWNNDFKMMATSIPVRIPNVDSWRNFIWKKN